MTTATLTTTAYDRFLHANCLLGDLVNNEDAEAAADYGIVCDGATCNALVDPDEYDDHEGLCDTCYSETHFLCETCTDWYSNEDQHPKHNTMCEDCGNDFEEECLGEERDKLSDRFIDLVTRITDEFDGATADHIALLKKAIKGLKSALKK